MNLAVAKQYFQRAIENDGRQVDSFRKLADIHVRESQPAKAIEMLEKSVLYVVFVCAYENVLYFVFFVAAEYRRETWKFSQNWDVYICG